MGQIKKIYVVIKNTCHECPFLVYNPNYGMSYDSGYDCGHEDSHVGRIVDDWEVNNHNNKNPKGWPSIPDGCPLESATEEEFKKYLEEVYYGEEDN